MTVKELVKPIILQRADPWIYKHIDGYYYFSASVPEYDRVEIRRAKTINGLSEADGVTIWRKHDEGMLSANIWAPEIHYIDGKWYIYFAAARTTETNEGLFDHRIFVLENESENPLEGEWVEKGQLKTNWESFALDATTFEHNGVRYLVWAQKDPNIYGNSNLYIAKMKNPWTIEDEQVMIAEPEYDWEKIGFLVNEGPAVLNRNGKIFISYSASATDYNYCMGVLIADENSDLLNKDSWHKSEKPVLKTDEENGIFGPGHSCFTVSEDGKKDMLVYHARNYKDIVGDPLYDPNRHTFVKELGYNDKGNIIFDLK
ncbi:MAG: glycoside hydrolase family 43 protein [Clostridium celatum]|uniref:glycoside hydrolase family 43 protein n=1 Tax=Clostridium sp. TaxID=1506 RepID=UPI0025BCE4A7|nr:glycoside hydrolase family 43 protein [Clostridium sp.]MBS4956729.1 glycoside hydrolase family 43 protein [Clostridium sp.]MDU2123229.1 glycoside hydrolase family 43 protein [Clostridium celatum]MDU4979482.1 glycoside hydrolase family 43 protein [Clostridium celatum]